MRETAEAPDDVAGPLGMGQVGLTEPPDKLDRSLLIGQIFGMTEGEIEEQRQPRLDRAIVPCIDGSSRGGARQGICRVHARRAAKGIARKLVKQQYQPQGALRRGQPSGQFAVRGRLVCREEAVAEGRDRPRARSRRRRGWRSANRRSRLPRAMMDAGVAWLFGVLQDTQQVRRIGRRKHA